MKNKNKYPDHYITINKKANKERVLVYRRNNLSYKKFKFIQNDGYYFDEYYRIDGYSIHLYIRLKSIKFYDLFNCQSSDLIKLYGGTNCFGIKIISPKINDFILKGTHIIGKTTEENGILICECKFICNKNSFKHKNNYNKNKYRVNSRRPYDSIYQITSWSLSHPYQGGGCSPK